MTDDQAKEEFEKALTSEVYKSAWRYSLRLAGNRPDAEDLLQSALALAFVRFAQLRRLDSFRAWLFAIIRNQFLSSLQTAQTAKVDIENCTLPSSSLPDSLVQDLLDAMDSLPANLQEILVLFYFENLSLKETAEVLRIRTGAVKQRLLRARRALREKVIPQKEPGVMARRGDMA